MLISADYGMHRSIVEGNLIARKAVLPARPRSAAARDNVGHRRRARSDSVTGSVSVRG